MEAVTVTNALPSLQAVPYAGPAAVGGIFLSMYVMKKLAANQKATRVKLPHVPEVPGLPLVGNLLQLKERKPHKTFMGWAETHGPIYSIKTGSSDIIVVNSADLAREAMITRFPSISTRKMPAALKIFTQNKCMVATSDYDEFHKMVKKYLLANLAGASALRRHRSERDDMVETVSSRFQAHAKTNPDKPVNFREIYESELFSVSMKEAMGVDVRSIYVPELGATLSRDDLLHILVLDPMEGGLDVDWRDFFPFLGWVPNRSWEQRIQRMHFRRQAVMNALITEQKKRIARGETLDCHLDLLLAENTLTEKQISMLLWEVIIETADTTMVAVEWAIYELSKNPKYQAMLYQEIKRVCGSEKITEDNLREMPFLNAVFNETIRKYSPAPVIPLRYVHEDTEIGGYHIPAGTEIALNIYGCNMDKNKWENPEEWNPERFLNGDFDQRDLQKTMAFGAGKRSCAGALQATLLGSVSIGRLVQEFEWRLRDGEEENVDIVGLTTRKLQPLYVNIKPRAV